MLILACCELFIFIYLMKKWLKDSTIHQERATGIEPVIKAWEAFVLPLNYARIIKPSGKDYSILSISCQEKHLWYKLIMILRYLATCLI